MEERLQKVLARAGIASRREAEKLIQAGRVSVNDRVVRELGIKVDAELDEVAVDTVPVPRRKATGSAPRTYILLNKPRGVLCTVRDTHGRPTVVDLVPPRTGKRLYPVGRLDEDSEGLVILTDDGDLTERLTHPRYRVPKIYDVRVRGFLGREEAAKFEAGVWLSDGKTGRSRVRVKRPGPRVTHVHVTLTEGRNRELRRAFARLGFPVISVRRVQIGPVVGRGLKPGQARPLAADEVQALMAASEGRIDARPVRTDRRPGGGTRPRRRPGKPDPALFATRRKEREAGRDGTAEQGSGKPSTPRAPGRSKPPTGTKRAAGRKPGAEKKPGGRKPAKGVPARGGKGRPPAGEPGGRGPGGKGPAGRSRGTGRTGGGRSR